MPGGNYLLDTNAAIDLLNQSSSIAVVLSATNRPYLPIFALAELEFGARNSGNPKKNLDAIERLLKETLLLIPNRETAAVYGEIEVVLRKKGRPIPANDLWIAALALQHQLSVLTRDAHFKEVESLQTHSW